MNLIILLLCSLALFVVLIFITVMAVIDSPIYSERMKINLSKDNKKFISSLDSKKDEIILTACKNTSYNVYVYAKIKDRFLGINYDKFKTYGYPEPLDVDNLSQLINYLYSTTGHMFTIVDKTKVNSDLVEELKTLNTIPVSRIEDNSI